jgi:hypothetical protein
MPEPGESISTRKWVLLALVLVLLLGLLGAGGYFFFVRTPQALAKRAIRKTEHRVDLASLVTQIRELSRLETASMRVMHVSTITQSYGVIPDQILGDKLTFLAVGDVIAGVDLSLIAPNDVKYSGDGVLSINLPRPQVLVTRLDNNQSRVIDRDTGVLRRADPHLESRVRAQAEASIRNEALKKGILTMAEQNGQKKLAEFLNKLGFQRVRFEGRQAAPRL